MFHFCVCVMLFLLCFFFFKQKTAYMMRISDGSSDVCSSYLNGDSTSSARTERKNALFAPWRERFLWRPSNPQHPVDPLRHQRGRRPVPRLVEPVTALARLEVQLPRPRPRSEEHTSELQSLMRISYAVSCLKKHNTSNSHLL